MSFTIIHLFHELYLNVFHNQIYLFIQLIQSFTSIDTVCFHLRFGYEIASISSGYYNSFIYSLNK